MGAITILDIRVKGKNSKSSKMTFRSWEYAERVYERNVQTCNNPDEVRRCNGWQLYSIALIDRKGNIKKQFDNFC
jgi:hypothetical protein